MNFDTLKVIYVIGVVTSFSFNDPNGLISVQSKTEYGNSEDWKFEFFAPSEFHPGAWATNTLKVGDKVMLFGYPAKENPHYCQLTLAKRESGEIIGKRPITKE